jgi:hypothetical protein
MELGVASYLYSRSVFAEHATTPDESPVSEHLTRLELWRDTVAAR